MPRYASPYQVFDTEVRIEMQEWICAPLRRLTLGLLRNHRRNRVAV
jgi:hypothetical protein